MFVFWQALSALSSQAASLTLQHAASDLSHAIKTQENIFKTTLKQHWVKVSISLLYSSLLPSALQSTHSVWLYTLLYTRCLVISNQQHIWGETCK